jgi:hypothetical protein
MRHFFTLLFLIGIFTNLSSQSLKTLTSKYPSPVRMKEVFQVFKERPAIKNGFYKKYKYKKLIETGFFKENKKDSTWHIYSLTGRLMATGRYEADTLVGIWSYFSTFGTLLQKYDHDKDSLIYFDVKEEKKAGHAPNVYPDTAQAQQPLFIGGTAFMNTLIQNNMIYPKDAYLKVRSATVYITFIIDRSGNTTEVKSIKPIGDGLDEEGIRLVELFGKGWIPGVQKGKKVRVQFNLPIAFNIR